MDLSLHDVNSDAAAAAYRQRQRRQLRYLLDTPLTKEAAKWIDTLVEAVEGHSDRLDHWVDAWHAYATAAAAAQSEEDQKRQASLGQLTVQALLQAAGQLSDKYN
jgi:ribosomal protein L12E/L44/L45/RPP1/RPP2